MSDARPAWSEAFDPDQAAPVAPMTSTGPINWNWAVGASTGSGVRVAVVDSGVDETHPRVGSVAGAVSIDPDDGHPDGYTITEGPHTDRFGHGTACAGIIRSIAPDVELHSVRVLGEQLTGKGWIFAIGLDWAIDAGMHVINLSLSTSNPEYIPLFHELTDRAAHAGIMVVSAMANETKTTIPSEFSAVFSTAAIRTDDPHEIRSNRNAPAEWGARGIDVEVAWGSGTTILATGNSFAAPHLAGIIALIRANHPDLTAYQMKTVLTALARQPH